MRDLQTDWCRDHGGWGSSKTPCKVCGVLKRPSEMPLMPEGLSFREAFAWGAKEVNKQIKKQIEDSAQS